MRAAVCCRGSSRRDTVTKRVPVGLNSRVAGQRELAPPSKSQNWGFNSNVFSYIRPFFTLSPFLYNFGRFEPLAFGLARNREGPRIHAGPEPHLQIVVYLTSLHLPKPFCH